MQCDLLVQHAQSRKSMDLELKGYKTDLFPIKVGARGISRSTYAFLTKIGLSSRERTKEMAECHSGSGK